jgi:hypothetical protein
VALLVSANLPNCPSTAADIFARKRRVEDHTSALFTIFPARPKPFDLLVYYRVGLERTEGAMQPGCYVVEKYQSRWVVSVDGAKVLICDRKRIAMAVVKAAAARSPEGSRDPASDTTLSATPAPGSREAAR